MTRIASALALSAVMFLSLAPPARAQTYSVLWNFKNLGLGQPSGKLRLHGSLFGTGSGEDFGNGQVFALTKSGSSWTSKTILNFDKSDGAVPFSGLIQDSTGALFGTSSLGDVHGHGNVFTLFKSGNSWIHSTLWAFGASGDGQTPSGDLVMDSAGNIYGTTFNGGAYGNPNTGSGGIVFELSLVNGNWTETILHSFGNGTDGSQPVAGILLDKSGALYGTTLEGGTSNLGTVFRLSKFGGSWTYNVLYNFNGSTDGGLLYSGLIEDALGNLYGTADIGGISTDCDGAGCGVVFELSKSGGAWTEKVLYSFTGGPDGAFPYAGLVSGGSKFNGLYGVGASGGDANGDGVVFKLSHSGKAWHETTIYTFGSIPNDGMQPETQVTLDASGNLYGTTLFGGTHDSGIVWQITP